MLTRVTNQTLIFSAQQNLAASKANLARMQQQASDLKAINKPSDSPAKTASSLQVRGEQAASAQYERNIDNGRGWLTTIDSALTNTTDILRRVKDLTLQGASGTMSPAARGGIAAELRGLRADTLGHANISFMGRSVFAGNSNAGVAFTNTTPPVFTGTTSTVIRRVADGTTVRVDADGAAIFGSGTGNVFDLIDKIAADLLSGADQNANLTALDQRMSTVVALHAEIGGQDSRIQRAQENNMKLQGELEAQRADIEDVDTGRAFLDLQVMQTNYSAALAITAKVLPQTLMDFLR